MCVESLVMNPFCHYLSVLHDLYFFVTCGKNPGCLKAGGSMLETEMIDSQLVQIYTKADLTVLIFIYYSPDESCEYFLMF